MPNITIEPNTTAVDVALNLSGSIAGLPGLLSQLPIGKRIGFDTMPTNTRDVEDIGQTWTPDLVGKTIDVTLPVYNEIAKEKAPFTTDLDGLAPLIEEMSDVLGYMTSRIVTYEFNHPTAGFISIDVFVDEGSRITLQSPQSLGIPDLPTDAKFIGWIYNGEMVTTVDVTTDMTVTANITADIATITYTYDTITSGILTVTDSALVNTTYVLRTPQDLGLPAIGDDYVFNGWLVNGVRTTELVVMGDVNVVAEVLRKSDPVEIEVNATSGSFIVPLCNVNSVTYSYNIYVNNTLHGVATGTSNQSQGTGYNITGLTGATAVIRIEPTGSMAAGWARPFGFSSDSTGCNAVTNKAKLLHVLQDPDLAHMVNNTDCGVNFRASQYAGCTSLTEAVPEALPDGVTAILDSFRSSQYSGCTALTQAATETMPASVTQVGSNFRINQYMGCTALVNAPAEAMSSAVLTIGENFRRFQYQNCSSLTAAAVEAMSSVVQTVYYYFRASQYSNCAALTAASTELLPSTVRFVGYDFRYLQYERCRALTQIPNEVAPPTNATVGDSYRRGQYLDCTALSVGGYIHDYGFPTRLGGLNMYHSMFSSNTAVTTADTLPRYYTNAERTSTLPVTETGTGALTPPARLYYVQNRTGIDGYATINANWK